MIKALVAQAREGKNVYITDLHARFQGLAESESEHLVCVVAMLDGSGHRRFDLKLPALEDLDAEDSAFVASYLHAEIYNIISALGGRSVTFYADPDRTALADMLARLPEVFGVGLPRAARPGYGRAINVAERMAGAMLPGGGSFSFHIESIAKAPEPATPAHAAVDTAQLFRRTTERLAGRAIVGVDVGGTDIKAALVDDGQVVDYLEYDWFPAGFLRSAQLVEPICTIVRLLVARLWIHRLPESDVRRARLRVAVGRALGAEAGDAGMAEALAEAEAEGFDMETRLDGIGLCFPDVVVRNKIVGGEVYKTRGIRNNPAIDYESDFAQLTHLDERLRAWVKPEAPVRIINDGPMASFTAAVEMAASPRAHEVAHGIFAHTLGTELGTGWVTDAGMIPDIPLEVYNFIIDLGCIPERAFEPDDLRSVNNFNTGLPGTLQKYCSQSGVFRLALKYFPSSRPDLLSELQSKGYIESRTVGGVEGRYVPTEPVDQRKPFLEHLMRLPDRERDEANFRIWREIGESLAVTALETKRILDPGTDERFLFGRLVKNPTCFRLMQEGAARIDPGLSLVVAGTGMAFTPLMRQLEQHPRFTVAQFAQALGAVYFAME